MGGNRWQVAVYVGRDSAGRQRRVTKLFEADGERAARRKAAAVETALRATLSERSHERRTVGWLADEWQAHRAAQPGASPNTIGRQAYLLERIKDTLGPIRLERLTPVDIEQFYAELRTRRTRHDRPLTESTVHHYHRILKAIIRQGHRWGYVDQRVIERVTPPSPRRRRPVRPNTTNVDRVLAAAPGDFGVLLRVLAMTGARRSEVLALRWSDLEGSTLVFRRTLVEVNKGRVSVKEWLKNPDEEPRHVTVDPQTVAMLDGWRNTVTQAIRDTGSRFGDGVYMFPDLRADPSGRTPRHPDTVTRRFAETCKEVGVTMRLHDLRHWHATQLVDLGVSIVDVSERLGHAQVSTTVNYYAHSTGNNGERAAALVAGLLGNGESPRPEPGA